MRGVGVAASAALGILFTSFSSAHAGEVRAAMSISAYVSVTGSIDVRASAQEPAHTASAANVAKIGSCASVAMVCKGPRSMRVTIRTDDNASAHDGSDLCASSANSMSVCTSNQTNASLLGVTVEY